MLKTKQCSKCKEVKPLGEFPKDKNRLDGCYPYCRPCRNKQSRILYHKRGGNRDRPYTPASKKWHREYHIKSKYGLTPKQHKQMYLAQNGCCDLCGKPVEYSKVHTDHDHITGKVRGLLCVSCNLGMSFVDNKDFMEKAVKYAG